MYKRRDIIDTNLSCSDFSGSDLYSQFDDLDEFVEFDELDEFDEFDQLDDQAVGGVAQLMVSAFFILR